MFNFLKNSKDVGVSDDGKDFRDSLSHTKQYVRDAIEYVTPKKVTYEELQEAKRRYRLAQEQFEYSGMEDNDSASYELTLAEINLSKLIKAQKLYEREYC